jgi:hypothetical protein
MRQTCVILGFVLFVACTTTSKTTNSGIRYTLEVDSYGEDSLLIEKDFFLYLADSSINTNDMQFQEFYVCLIKFFTQRGYRFVDSIQEANIIIFFTYGITDPITSERTLNLPVHGQTGTKSTTTTGSISRAPFSNELQYSQKTYNQPTYGVTGYNTVHHTVTKYTKYLFLTACDFDYLNPESINRKLWQTYITSTDKYNDMRKVFPYMLIGSRDFIGHSSSENKKLYIYENDISVQQFKGK